jgi:polyisoprenoid-binding protein YceI
MRTFFLVFLTVSLISSCKNEPKKDVASTETAKPDTIRVEEVPTEGAETYVLTEGLVYWVGRKATGSEHNGTIACSGGEILVNQGQILSGKITIDMNAINVLDLKDAGEKRELESHLRDGGFFDAKKYPTGQFTIEEALPSNMSEFNTAVSGKLTLKGKTNPLNIPAKVTINGDELTAESPAFVIDRTKWGINYESGILGAAKDNLIDDGVRLAIKVRAKKKQ